MNRKDTVPINARIPDEIINLFKSNNIPFENLERPGFFSSETRSRNYKACIQFYRELKMKESDFKMVYSYTYTMLKELDNFVNERTEIEKMFYDNMKNIKSITPSLIPQQAPEDAGLAQFKATDEKRQQIQKLFDSIEHYNNVVGRIKNYYEDNFSTFYNRVIGFIDKKQLPIEIDIQLILNS